MSTCLLYPGKMGMDLKKKKTQNTAMLHCLLSFSLLFEHCGSLHEVHLHLFNLFHPMFIWWGRYIQHFHKKKGNCDA